MKLEKKTNKELVKMWIKYTEKIEMFKTEKYGFGRQMSNVEFTNHKLQDKVGNEIMKRYFGDKVKTKDYYFWMFEKEIWKNL